MSIQAVAWVLEHSESRGIERLVLISLANHHNGGTGQCNPGQRLIAKEAGIATGTVSGALGRLVELGEVEIEDPGGSHRSARYMLPFAQEVSVLPGNGARSMRGQDERSARPKGAQNRKNHDEPRAQQPETVIPNPYDLPSSRAEVPDLSELREKIVANKVDVKP